MSLIHIEKEDQKKYFGSSIFQRDKVYMLFGSVGSGKSTLSNALLNNGVKIEHLIKPSHTSSGTDSTTKSPMVYRSDKKNITVIDTCGLNDRDMSSKQIVENLLEFVRLLYAGVDYIIYCVRKGRFTEEDIQNWKLLNTLIGEDSVKTNVIYCMTHAEDEINFEEYMKKKEVKEIDKTIMGTSYARVAVEMAFSINAKIDAPLESEWRIPSLKRLQESMPFSEDKPKKLYISMNLFDKVYANIRSWWHGGKEIILDMKKVIERRALWVTGDCPVCLEPILNDKYLSICGHLYHFDCMASWHAQCRSASRPTTCPLCRKALVTELEVIKVEEPTSSDVSALRESSLTTCGD